MSSHAAHGPHSSLMPECDFHIELCVGCVFSLPSEFEELELSRLLRPMHSTSVCMQLDTVLLFADAQFRAQNLAEGS